MNIALKLLKTSPGMPWVFSILLTFEETQFSKLKQELISKHHQCVQR